MVRIEVLADDQLFAALSEVAKRRDTTVEDLAQSALRQFIVAAQPAPRNYSFIGIASSEHGGLSQTVDETLSEINEREGWSLPE